MNHYLEIVTPEVQRAISEQEPDKLFANEGGAMIGNGAVWFRCPDDLLTNGDTGSFHCDDRDIRILAIGD